MYRVGIFLTALSRLFLLTYQTLYESSEKFFFFFFPVCSMLCTAGYHMRLIPQADHLLFFFLYLFVVVLSILPVAHAYHSVCLFHTLSAVILFLSAFCLTLAQR